MPGDLERILTTSGMVMGLGLGVNAGCKLVEHVGGNMEFRQVRKMKDTHGLKEGRGMCKEVTTSYDSNYFLMENIQI